MQRLFSTFANGWPGIGLLIQRAVAATFVGRWSLLELVELPHSVSMLPQIVAACAAVFLLVGLWTPIAGVLIAVIEIWVAIHCFSDPSIAIALATISATVAMIGPGAWSVDARLFGRKHIET